MDIFGQIKRSFLALPLCALLALASCSSGASGVTIPTSLYPASEMTQTQIANASDGAITVSPTTKKLLLKGAAGKTIYMARSNISNTAMDSIYSRLAKITTGVSASEEKSALFLQAEEKEIEAAIISGFETDLENDPHAKIWKLSMDNIKKAKAQRLISKSLDPGAQNAVKNYAVDDTETFWALNPETMETFDERTFKLLVSEANYNVWVDVDDKYYTQGTAAFETAAQTMGTNFINGYGLVSHLYGQPSDKIYNADDSVYGPMSTASKTGLKINIMLYDMLTVGKVYGFVYHSDIRHNVTGSNEGRFVYMDSQTTLKDPLEAYSTAQHEFSHTISFNQKTMIHKKEWTYWYGELLAMMCEDMMQAYFGISDSDVNDKLGNTPKARLPTANYNDEWACGLTGQTSPTYAATFHLGAWLVRKFGGPKFIKEIATNAYVDFDSILAAVKAASGKDYTITSLLQEKAGDLMERQNNAGFNQDGATYPENANYTCAYSDASGKQQTYEYPLTAINLWAPFYGWCDQSKYAENITNTSISFDQLPDANVYKKADWKGNAPTTAYLGPLKFKGGKGAAQIGPYGSMLFNLGEATSDSVTIEFSLQPKSDFFRDTLTIYVK